MAWLLKIERSTTWSMAVCILNKLLCGGCRLFFVGSLATQKKILSERVCMRFWTRLFILRILHVHQFKFIQYPPVRCLSLGLPLTSAWLRLRIQTWLQNDLETASECSPCPAGHYCLDGNVTSTCSAGYFCKIWGV